MAEKNEYFYLASYDFNLTFKLNLDMVTVNRHATYLGQRSLSSNFIVRTHNIMHIGPTNLSGPLNKQPMKIDTNMSNLRQNQVNYCGRLNAQLTR